MQGNKGDKIRLSHILDAINEIEIYLSGATTEVFMENSMMRFACIKQLEIIGEASNHISDETKSKFPEVEWAQINGMRNVFVHEYFGVDSSLVWQIIKSDLPNFKQKIDNILKTME